MLAMQHPAFRNMAIADLDWLIGPAILTGNFIILNGTRPEGLIIPVAAITWARVSPEVDARIVENLHRPFRLSPAEYISGEIYWLAHSFGPPQAVKALIQKAREDGQPLAGKELKQRVRDDNGGLAVAVVG